MSNDNCERREYEWILGYLSAFEHINDRRNTPSHVQFERILHDGTLEERVNQFLNQNSHPCRDVQKIVLASLESVSDELSATLQAWLFDFMFFELKKVNNMKLPLWDDPNQYFNLSVEKMRSDRANFLSKKIIDLCQPIESYRVKLETGKQRWYQFGTNFLFTNKTDTWWLRLGEVF